MTRLLDALFSTTGAAIILFACAIWIVVRPKSAAARRATLAIATFYFVASVYAVPAALSRLLAIGYTPLERLDWPPDQTAMVILGSGVEVIFGWDERISLPNPGAGARVLEAVRVYRLLKPRWVISSGGISKGEPAEPSSTNMRDLLVRLGVPEDRIILESASRDTHSEAIEVAAMLDRLGVNRLILVTSAVHMRRSVGAFRAVGVNPVPAIAPDPRFRDTWAVWLVPRNQGLRFSSEVVHELAGLPYYWLRGWWHS